MAGYNNELYNVLMGNAGTNNSIGRNIGLSGYTNNTANQNPTGYFARKGRSLENAFGTTGAALYETRGDLLGAALAGATGLGYTSARDKAVTKKADTIRKEGLQAIDDVYRNFGFAGRDDFNNQLDEAERNGDQAKVNSLLNNTALNDALKATATSTNDAMTKHVNDYKDYRANNYASQKINQDRGKFLGSSINTLSTMTDVLGLTSSPLANGIQGAIEGVADELEDNGFNNFSADRARENAISGALSGMAVGAFNKGLGKTMKANGGNLFKGGNKLTAGLNNLGAKHRITSSLLSGAARGGASGAIGGAVGAGSQSAMNGVDLGQGIQNTLSGAVQGAKQGALTGGVMSAGNMAVGATPIGRVIRGSNLAKERWDDLYENGKGSKIDRMKNAWKQSWNESPTKWLGNELGNEMKRTWDDAKYAMTHPIAGGDEGADADAGSGARQGFVRLPGGNDADADGTARLLGDEDGGVQDLRSPDKFVSVDPLGNRAEYSLDDVQNLIKKYESYKAPEVLSGNSSSEALEALGPEGAELVSIFQTMNGGVGDPVYSHDDFNQFRDWIDGIKATAGNQAPTNNNWLRNPQGIDETTKVSNAVTAVAQSIANLRNIDYADALAIAEQDVKNAGDINGLRQLLWEHGYDSTDIDNLVGDISKPTPASATSQTEFDQPTYNKAVDAIAETFVNNVQDPMDWDSARSEATQMLGGARTLDDLRNVLANGGLSLDDVYRIVPETTGGRSTSRTPVSIPDRNDYIEQAMANGATEDEAFLDWLDIANGAYAPKDTASNDIDARIKQTSYDMEDALARGDRVRAFELQKQLADLNMAKNGTTAEIEDFYRRSYNWPYQDVINEAKAIANRSGGVLTQQDVMNKWREFERIDDEIRSINNNDGDYMPVDTEGRPINPRNQAEVEAMVERAQFDRNRARSANNTMDDMARAQYGDTIDDAISNPAFDRLDAEGQNSVAASYSGLPKTVSVDQFRTMVNSDPDLKSAAAFVSHNLANTDSADLLANNYWDDIRALYAHIKNGSAPVDYEPIARDQQMIQGMKWSIGDAKKATADHIQNILRENGIGDVEIKGLEVNGSRVRGDARGDSDLDVVVEYSGNMREDDLFNLLNDAENKLALDGVDVDINPIRADKSGTLEDFMARSNEYDRQKMSAEYGTFKGKEATALAKRYISAYEQADPYGYEEAIMNELDNAGLSNTKTNRTKVINNMIRETAQMLGDKDQVKFFAEEMKDYADNSDGDEAKAYTELYDALTKNNAPASTPTKTYEEAINEAMDEGLSQSDLADVMAQYSGLPERIDPADLKSWMNDPNTKLAVSAVIDEYRQEYGRKPTNKQITGELWNEVRALKAQQDNYVGPDTLLGDQEGADQPTDSRRFRGGYVRLPSGGDDSNKDFGDRSRIKVNENMDGFLYAGKYYNLVKENGDWIVTRNSAGIPIAMTDGDSTPQKAFDAFKAKIDARDGYSEPTTKIDTTVKEATIIEPSDDIEYAPHRADEAMSNERYFYAPATEIESRMTVDLIEQAIDTLQMKGASNTSALNSLVSILNEAKQTPMKTQGEILGALLEIDNSLEQYKYADDADGIGSYPYDDDVVQQISDVRETMNNIINNISDNLNESSDTGRRFRGGYVRLPGSSEETEVYDALTKGGGDGTTPTKPSASAPAETEGTVDITSAFEQDIEPIKKRNALQSAGARARATARVQKYSGIYDSLDAKTAERAVKTNAPQRLADLGIKAADYTESAKFSSYINRVATDLAKNSKVKVNVPDLIDRLNPQNLDVQLSDASLRTYNSYINKLSADGDSPAQYTAGNLLEFSRWLGDKAANLRGGADAKDTRQALSQAKYVIRDIVANALDEAGVTGDLTNDNIAKGLAKIGANEKVQDYFTEAVDGKAPSISDYIRRSSLFEQARDMGSQIEAEKYTRSASKAPAKVGTRLYRASGLDQPIEALLRSTIAPIAAKGTDLAGRTLEGLGNLYARVSGNGGGSTGGGNDGGSTPIRVPNTSASNDPSLELWNSIGRNAGISETEDMRNQATANANRSAINLGAGRALGLGDGINNYDETVNNVPSSASGNLATTNGTASGSTAGTLQSTGDYWTDLIGQAMMKAVQDNNVETFGPLFEMYQERLASLKSNESSSEKLTDKQRQANAAALALDDFEQAEHNLAYDLSDIPVVGNIANLGGNDYQSKAEALALQIGYMLSGATVNKEEAKNIGMAYVPQPRDNEAVRASKLRQLRGIISEYQRTS